MPPDAPSRCRTQWSSLLGVPGSAALACHKVGDLWKVIHWCETGDVADALARPQEMDAGEGASIGVPKALDGLRLRDAPVLARTAKEAAIGVEKPLRHRTADQRLQLNDRLGPEQLERGQNRLEHVAIQLQKQAARRSQLVARVIDLDPLEDAQIVDRIGRRPQRPNLPSVNAFLASIAPRQAYRKEPRPIARERR